MRQPKFAVRVPFERQNFINQTIHGETMLDVHVNQPFNHQTLCSHACIGHMSKQVFHVSRVFHLQTNAESQDHQRINCGVLCQKLILFHHDSCLRCPWFASQRHARGNIRVHAWRIEVPLRYIVCMAHALAYLFQVGWRWLRQLLSCTGRRLCHGRDRQL